MGIVDDLWAGLGAPILQGYECQSIIQYPQNVQANAVQVEALVAIDSELGTNQAPGDGPVTTDPHGDRERRSGHLEIPPTGVRVSDGVEVAIVCDDRDVWVIDGKQWTTQRQTGYDVGGDGYQGWLITRELGRLSHHPRVRNDRGGR